MTIELTEKETKFLSELLELYMHDCREAAKYTLQKEVKSAWNRTYNVYNGILNRIKDEKEMEAIVE